MRRYKTKIDNIEIMPASVFTFRSTDTHVSRRETYLGTHRALKGKFMNDAIVFNMSCEGTKTSLLRDAFFEMGAKAYLGYSEPVMGGFSQYCYVLFFI